MSFLIYSLGDGHKFPYPLFQQEAEKNPQRFCAEGSLPEKVIIVINVPVLHSEHCRSSVPFSELTF